MPASPVPSVPPDITAPAALPAIAALVMGVTRHVMPVAIVTAFPTSRVQSAAPASQDNTSRGLPARRATARPTAPPPLPAQTRGSVRANPASQETSATPASRATTALLAFSAPTAWVASVSTAQTTPARASAPPIGCWGPPACATPARPAYSARLVLACVRATVARAPAPREPREPGSVSASQDG